MKTCRWIRGEYGWIRLFENESLLVINGKSVGTVRLRKNNILEWMDRVMTLDYVYQMSEPEYEVFV